jgi:hypothetical protein
MYGAHYVAMRPFAVLRDDVRYNKEIWILDKSGQQAVDGDRIRATGYFRKGELLVELLEYARRERKRRERYPRWRDPALLQNNAR